MTSQGITSLWAQKEAKILSNDISTPMNFIALLIAFTSFISVLVFLLLYVRRYLSCPLTTKSTNAIALTSTNSVIVDDLQHVQETNIDSKFNHILLPNASDGKISITNCPLPPVPKQLPIIKEKLERQDSKNSLVSDDDDYLMPRDPLRLHAFEMEDDYSKPSFHSLAFCNNVNLDLGNNGKSIPMRSY